jgi:single-stranded DNA-specific DHH superfamily exonuclease
MEEHTESSVIVMGNPNWRPGILGLVANSLVQAHGKPVFSVGREGGEVIRGSVRGDGIVNVVNLMDAAQRMCLIILADTTARAGSRSSRTYSRA